MRVPAGDVYVSSVAGHVVPRFGTGSATARAQRIGCYAVVETKKNGETVFTGLRWDTEEVVRIPQSEFIANLKDYSNALAHDALREREAAEYEAQQEKQAADSKAEGEAIAKAAAKPAEKLAKPSEAAAPVVQAAKEVVGASSAKET